MFKKFFLSLSITAALTSSVLANEMTVHTERGDVSVKTPPAKVAVFDTTSLDILQALNVPVAGAPNDLGKMLPYLNPTFSKAKDVGTIFEPNLETLNELQPDLIIIGGRSSKKYDDVKGLATTIDVTDTSTLNTVESGLSKLELYGNLFEKQADAAKIKTELETLLNQTKEAVKGKGNGLVLLITGEKMSTFGAKGRMGWVHSALGIPEAVTDMSDKGSSHGEPVTFEFVQKANPDWLFVLDRAAAIGQEGQTAKEMLDNALVRQTKAWKNNHVIYLSSTAYLTPGGIEQLRTDLTNIKNAFEHP